jgi:hypothetical protein
MNRHLHRFALLLLLAGAAAPAALAQNAQLTGRVVDPGGGVVVGASVTATNTDTGISREAVTNDEGYFTLPLLPRGNYQLSLKASGFRPVARTGVTLDEGQTLRLDFTLEVGGAQETIQISGEAPLLEAANATTSTVIENRKVLDLPLNGRNPLVLSALVPGVRPIGQFGGLPVSSFINTQTSIGGGAANANNFMVDGTAAENFPSNGLITFPSVDATEEFRIITRNPSAEYGRTGGGVINIISKSGTNEYHGSAWEFYRGRVLNANSWLNNRSNVKRGPFVQNQYGFTLGGPVWLPKVYDGHKRTFFFFNFEQAKQRVQASTNRIVPTAEQRAGDFRNVRDAAGNVIPIYDPLTTRPDPARPGSFIRDQISCNGVLNVICPNRINPVAAEVLKFYPQATDPAARAGTVNFVGVASSGLDVDGYGIRLDHNFTPERKVFGRWTHNDTTQFVPNFYGNVAEIQNSDLIFKRRSAVLGYTDALGANLLLEARVGFNRYNPLRTTRSFGFDLTQLKLPAALNNQVQFRLFPRFNIGDVSVIGADQGDHLIQANDAYTAAGSLTYIRGAHTFKTGVEERIYRGNNSQANNVISFAFDRTFTRGPDPNTAAQNVGNGFATFLLGHPTGGDARRFPATTYTNKSFGAFIQDDWKVSPKLTLNLGVRWEVESVVTDRFDAISNFDPDLPVKLGSLDLRGGLIYPGVNGVPRGHRDQAWGNVGPRFGFAYQANQKTVVRGGYGLYYLPTTGNFTRLGRTGFEITTPIVTTLDAGRTPAGTVSNPFPNGILQPPGSSQGALTGLGTPIEGNERTTRRGVSHQWNLNVQRELAGGLLVEVGYIGNRGLYLPATFSFDILPQSNLALGTQLQQQVQNPFFGLIPASLVLGRATVARAELLTTYPQFAGVTGLGDWASSVYHAGTLKVEKRFARGLSLLTAYTWSKLIDSNDGSGDFNQSNFYAGGNNRVQNWENLRAERSISSNDLPHRLVVTTLWELPFGREGGGLYRRLVGGWQVNSIVAWQSGNPISVSQNMPVFGGFRPNLKGAAKPPNQTLDVWLNRAAFEAAPAFTFGNAPRNLSGIRTDDNFNWDFSVLKKIQVVERVRLEFRAEFFNFTNHPVFAAPNGNISSPDFGRVTNTLNSPRQIQFGLKLIF